MTSRKGSRGAWSLAVATALHAALGAAASAQPQDLAEGAKAAIAEPDNWLIRIEPSAWWVSPGGKFRLPGPANESMVRTENFNLDSPRISPALEVDLKTEDWRVEFSGFGYTISDRGSTQVTSGGVGSIFYQPGDSLSSSLDFSSYQMLVGRRLLLGLPGEEDPGGPFSANLEVVGGVRFYSTDFTVSQLYVIPSDPFEPPPPLQTTAASEFFGEPVLGVKLTFEVAPRITIDAQFTAGGFTDGGSQSSWSWDIVAGFMWRPVDNVGVQIGYRNLSFDLLSGEGQDWFEYRGAMAGLYAGLVIRF